MYHNLYHVNLIRSQKSIQFYFFLYISNIVHFFYFRAKNVKLESRSEFWRSIRGLSRISHFQNLIRPKTRTLEFARFKTLDLNPLFDSPITQFPPRYSNPPGETLRYRRFESTRRNAIPRFRVPPFRYRRDIWVTRWFPGNGGISEGEEVLLRNQLCVLSGCSRSRRPGPPFPPPRNSGGETKGRSWVDQY